MRVLVFTRYGRLGASSRVRFYQYIPYLASRGIDVTVAPLLEDTYIQRLYGGQRKDPAAIFGAYINRLGQILKSRRFDLVWVEKELLPWLPAWAETFLSVLRIPYVVDYDDAVFHNYDLHRSGLFRRLMGGKIDAAMRSAALVTVGNDYLAERARHAGAKRVEYLPSVVDLDRYTITPQPVNETLTIGWIGAPVTTRYVHPLTAALSSVCQNGKARLVLVGANEDIQLRDVPMSIRGWSEETEVRDIQEFDIGIMPLPDEPWTRGKCGYKLIQYMACGRPVVASPVGVNRQIVEHGSNGFLADDLDSWVDALTALRDSRELRIRMGQAGRLKVEQQYCLQVTAPRLVSILRAAVSL